jgi:hypothetical protein
MEHHAYYRRVSRRHPTLLQIPHIHPSLHQLQFSHHPPMEHQVYYQRVQRRHPTLLHLHTFTILCGISPVLPTREHFVLLYLHIFHQPLMYTPSSLDVLAQ